MAAPDLSRLQAQLLVSGLQQQNPALYQVIWQLIQNAKDFLAQLATISAASGGVLSDASFLTYDSELLNGLPLSKELIAGTNVTFDDSVFGQRIVNVEAAEDGVWFPLTDGDPDEADLIFNSFGECIMVFVPNP